MSATTFFVADIQVGTLHRRELGDIDALAHSIAAVGLLHPIVVTPAGANRWSAENCCDLRLPTRRAAEEFALTLRSEEPDSTRRVVTVTAVTTKPPLQLRLAGDVVWSVDLNRRSGADHG